MRAELCRSAGIVSLRGSPHRLIQRSARITGFEGNRRANRTGLPKMDVNIPPPPAHRSTSDGSKTVQSSSAIPDPCSAILDSSLFYWHFGIGNLQSVAFCRDDITCCDKRPFVLRYGCLLPLSDMKNKQNASFNTWSMNPKAWNSVRCPARLGRKRFVFREICSH